MVLIFGFCRGIEDSFSVLNTCELLYVGTKYDGLISDDNIWKHKVSIQTTTMLEESKDVTKDQQESSP